MINLRSFSDINDLNIPDFIEWTIFEHNVKVMIAEFIRSTGARQS